jgi:hypothetical protein
MNQFGHGVQGNNFQGGNGFQGQFNVGATASNFAARRVNPGAGGFRYFKKQNNIVGSRFNNGQGSLGSTNRGQDGASVVGNENLVSKKNGGAEIHF